MLACPCILTDACVLSQIMATAEGNGGDDPTRRSRPLALKRGRPSREEKGKAIATESYKLSPTHSKKRRRGTGIVIVDHVVPEVQAAPTDSGLPEVAPGLEAPPDCVMSEVKPGLNDGSNDGDLPGDGVPPSY
ncbi:hypothetical protein L1049_005277 [Liquidambar formosana]|uniref:Uncharacterized protein n=1 Tax=Liquidambar formosana TaxID=63359 RepID=A0AAP0RQJ6_LIQFO